MYALIIFSLIKYLTKKLLSILSITLKINMEANTDLRKDNC